MAVLSKPQFCGQNGKRTFYIIKLTQGQARDITNYSLLPKESEVLLPPGCCFRVESVAPQGSDLTLVYLKEQRSEHWLLDLNVRNLEFEAACMLPPFRLKLTHLYFQFLSTMRIDCI